ncbi:MAG TPA: 3-deoxy-7-phosphoheptulonate synthase [Chlamydiales bacterium]|nr:3-deoxy-7-phosphoheptulonate synthase [Chlamydiales bacterium]
MELPTPSQIKHELPLIARDFIADARRTAQKILERKDERLVVIVGPCSIHDSESALEYARRLKKLTPEIERSFFPIMRLFIEKPRTRLGWKGMLYDPHLDGTNDIAAGLRKSRELFLQIADLGVACATELLEPIATPYFDDVVVWGLIGARTSASQPHRQMASGLHFPVGFKNDFRGELDVAIAGILTSRIPHSHIGINARGHVAALETRGNPLSHLVLRGSESSPNYDPESIANALRELREHRLEQRLIIDCSHGNCRKDHRRQGEVFASVVEQAVENKAIAGLMLESHLFEGKQPLGDARSLLNYGVSITDPCLDWEQTSSLLRSMSISSVQK